MKKILITGVSGNVGSEVLAKLLKQGDFKCKILLRPKPKNLKLGKKLSKKGVEVFYGDLQNLSDCEKFVRDGDYILHFAGVIPPMADHYPDSAYKSNVIGTQNLLAAIIKENPHSKFLYTSSYAEYGARGFKHAWGRVGDPLIPAVFDYYAVTKIKAECSVVSSEITWACLRLPGVLYDNILMGNISDAIMFHTPWNTPIEWSTARSIAHLVNNILTYDAQGRLDKSFWKNIYNIGDGESARVTGFETLDRGFQLMGKNVKYFFKPNWNPLKNFHCLWLEDSNKIHSFFDKKDIWCEGFYDFFNNMEKIFWYFKLGKPFSFIIKKIAIERLLKRKNAPLYWIKNNDVKKMVAFYGSVEKAKTLTENWDEFNLLCENKNPDTGEYLDYKKLKDKNSAKDFRLNHGYDETKKDLTLTDLQEAAHFRGGTCLAEKFPEDIHTLIEWQCSEGHRFKLSAFAVLKGGFWCNKCLDCEPDGFNKIAMNIPFYKQILT